MYTTGYEQDSRRIICRFPAGKRFFASPKFPFKRGATPNILNGNRGYIPGIKLPGLEADHLRVVPGSWIGAAIPPLAHVPPCCAEGPHYLYIYSITDPLEISRIWICFNFYAAKQGLIVCVTSDGPWYIVSNNMRAVTLLKQRGNITYWYVQYNVFCIENFCILPM